VRLAVTTPLRPSPAEEAEARAAAARHRLAYAPRGRQALDAALSTAGADAGLVLSATASVLDPVIISIHRHCDLGVNRTDHAAADNTDKDYKDD
jgi:hypothetical protein